ELHGGHRRARRGRCGSGRGGRGRAVAGAAPARGMTALRFRVGEGEAGRADRVVAARFPGASRKRLAELFAAGAVRIDGRVARKGEVVPSGAEVTVLEPPARDRADLAPVPEAGVALDVLYTDADIVVANKPAGMPSHPLRAGER